MPHHVVDALVLASGLGLLVWNNSAARRACHWWNRDLGWRVGRIHHGLDALERHQRPQIPAIPRLAAAPASTLLPTAPEPLSASEAVRRGRLRCSRRVLLPQRELPLQ